jgi:hypothetical protein
VWVDGVGCAITETNNTVLAATFIYTMCFDLVVLILNVLKLYRPNAAAGSSMATSSKLARMIFKDGVVFFAIAYDHLFLSFYPPNTWQFSSEPGRHNLHGSQPQSNHDRDL